MSFDDSSNTSPPSPVFLRRQSIQSTLPFFEFSENITNLTHSVAHLGKSITREYRSDFLLPCQTHIAITREEKSEPVKQLKTVTVDLVVGYTELSLRYEPAICRKLEQHLDEDIWAEIMAQYDRSNDRDLLYQLEEGCCNNPELYQITRVEKQKNRQIIIDMQPKGVLKVINISRRNSLDSCETSLTEITDGSDPYSPRNLYDRNDLQSDLNLSISDSNPNSDT